MNWFNKFLYGIKKTFGFLVWVAFSFAIGIIISYLFSEGSSMAYSFFSYQVKGIQGEQVVSLNLANVNEVFRSINTYEDIGDTKSSYKEISLVFVGDIMLDRGVEDSVYANFGGDYNTLFKNVSMIKDSDIAFGNLEGPISDNGSDLKNKYSFRMDPQALPALKNAGFDIISLANNHMGDWGRDAMKDTFARLIREEILYTGAGINADEARSPAVIEKNGIKIGFLAFSDVGPQWLKATDQKAGVLIIGEDYSETIRSAKEQVDLLVMSAHWGQEYISHTWRQEMLAKKAIDAGADIIIGHHPHVIQDTEWYNPSDDATGRRGYIAYSLGNFIFDQWHREDTMEGLILEIDIARNPFSQEIVITDTDKKLMKLNKYYQPDQILEYE